MERSDLIIDTVLLAGKIMIENGANMSRVDDTLCRIARNAGIEKPRIFETTTGIMMSIQGEKNAQVESINKRRIDLERISRVNDASRAFQAKKITLTEMHEKLQIIDQTTRDFGPFLKIIAAALIGGTLEVVYGGLWSDMLPTIVISGIGYASYYALNRFFHTEFASEFVAAVIIGICALIVTKIHLGTRMGMIIIGGIMPLVPGVLLTNAVRDLLAGHILSGAARIIEGFMTACALGMGIALVLRFS
ncbi:threonine/serine exporter family protein [Ligilactobacillus sp. LYQ135]